MGKRIVVTPEELGKAAEKLLDISDAYTQIYTQLFQTAGTMGEAWQGEDNLAFVDQINGFCEELKTMAEKLRTDAEALKTQQANYENRQQDNITQVRKLTN